MAAENKTMGQKWKEQLEKAAVIEGEGAVQETIQQIKLAIQKNLKEETPSAIVALPIEKLKWNLLCVGWKHTATLEKVMEAMKKEHISIEVVGCDCAFHDSDPCRCMPTAIHIGVAREN